MFFWQDIRYAIRLLAKNPFFTLLTITVLAGGLGLSIFTFSFLHTAILKPIPVPEGERIVRILTQTDRSLGVVEARDLALMRPSITSLSDVGVYGLREVVIGTREGTRAMQATETEWNIFQVTRTRPALGRGFTPDDQVRGAEPVIVLTDRAWRVLFGGDSSIIDQRVLLNGQPTRVIGVMPAGYGFPVASEAWVPLSPELLSPTVPENRLVQAYARLAAGVDARQANAELTGLLLRVREGRVSNDPNQAPFTAMTVSSYPMAQIGEEAPLVLAVLNTLATLILALACINVTNLLLARANERAKETAVRLALGAPRGRLIMQSMWESIVLCLAGGVLATALATWGLEAINTWCHNNLEGNLAFWWVWGFDRTVIYAAGAFVTVAMMVLGGVVSRRAVTAEITEVLKDGGMRGGGRKEGKVSRGLVITQVAVVSVLMFFGSMSAIIAYRVTSLNFGYDTRAMLTSGVELPEERFPTAERRGQFFQNLQQQLEQRPELSGVVLRSSLADLADDDGEFDLTGRPADGQRPHTYVMSALGPLSVMGSNLIDGRSFDTRDSESGPPTAMVSAAFAARYFAGRSPLGAQILMTGLGETEPRTVVGITGDVLLGNPLSRDRSAVAVYLPLRQTKSSYAIAFFRHRGSEADGRSAFIETVHGMDRQLEVGSVSSFDDMLGKSTLMARSTTKLFAGCFGFALLLAVSGAYGLMARAIGRQTRDIGVRRALGATDRSILFMLLGQGGRQLGVGALVALPFTLLVGWSFSQYFPIGLALSVATAVLVSLSITAVVLAATWLPTRRAIAIEPRDALWRE